MTTKITWLNDSIISIVWESPLTSEELKTCFNDLTEQIQTKDHFVDCLFDVTQAGNIPASAPIYATKSGFMSAENTGRIAVIGTDVIAKLLAQTAIKLTGMPIEFFPNAPAAIKYLKQMPIQE